MSLVPFTAPVRIAASAHAPPLSAAQALFNSLVETLELRRNSLAQWQLAQQACLQQTVQVLDPLRRAVLQQQLKWVAGLDAQLEVEPKMPGAEASWTRSERRLLQRAVCELAKPLVAQTGDQTLKALYNKHSSVDYDEEAQAEAAQFKRLLSDVYGLDMTHAKGDTREDLMDHARQQVAREQDRAARRKDRRKDRLQAQEASPAEQARDAAQKLRAGQTQQTIREVYRKLASALHPDREPDEHQRARKTDLMARVNQAYDRKELLQLLSLQLELAHIDAGQLGALSQDRLVHYNKLLKDQLADIDLELAQLEAALRQQLQLASTAPLTPDSALPTLQQQIAVVQASLDEAKAGQAALADPQALKRWLKARD